MNTERFSRAKLSMVILLIFVISMILVFRPQSTKALNGYSTENSNLLISTSGSLYQNDAEGYDFGALVPNKKSAKQYVYLANAGQTSMNLRIYAGDSFSLSGISTDGVTFTIRGIGCGDNGEVNVTLSQLQNAGANMPCPVLNSNAVGRTYTFAVTIDQAFLVDNTLPTISNLDLVFVDEATF